MRLLRLSIKGFRNLADQVLDVPEEGVAIVGSNAQGKTNLLEAVHYLETFRSPRGRRDEQLVRIGETLFRVEAEIGRRDVMRGRAAEPIRVVSAAYDGPTRQKRVSVDGQVPGRLGDAIANIGSVLFTPEDVRVVSEGPSERRRYLDILLSLNLPGYLEALRRFRQALQRRNAALRRGEGVASVAAWDDVLVRSGAQVSVSRALWIARHAARFSEYYGEVSGERVARMVYEPGIRVTAEHTADSVDDYSEGGDAVGGDPRVIDTVAEAYGAALEDLRESERRLRATLVGPHRDELRFYIEAPEGERDAREMGSGGEQRTIALALRLLEADTVREGRRREPILLLDDLFAELDAERSRRVLDLLDRRVPGQVVLTAPKESDVRFRTEALSRWWIEKGVVRK